MAKNAVLSSSVNAVGAKLKSNKNSRFIEGLTASSALSALTGVSLNSPVIADGIPSAGVMATVARAVEKAATDLQELTVYNTYVTVFDTIKSIELLGSFFKKSIVDRICGSDSGRYVLFLDDTKLCDYHKYNAIQIL